MAFDRGGDGELGPAGAAMQFESENRAMCKTAELAPKHAGVIAGSREAQPDLGKWVDPVDPTRYGDVAELA